MNIKNRGFTLIEVLVSMAVLGVGILGVAALQITNAQNNSNAYLRSQAVFLAYDIADRMRANPVAVGNGAYAAVTGSEDDSPLGFNCVTTFPAGSTCTEAEFALANIAASQYGWLSALAEYLPAGTGTIVCSDAPCTETSPHTVTISWNDLEGLPMSFDFRFTL
ncbi:MAG: type IV pilus modification protein PilV [Gammaproteobacteria bacterium]|nr:type IV pilus modification protein PilV [Gammaproteobacteria bacterium]